MCFEMQSSQGPVVLETADEDKRTHAAGPLSKCLLTVTRPGGSISLFWHGGRLLEMVSSYCTHLTTKTSLEFFKIRTREPYHSKTYNTNICSLKATCPVLGTWKSLCPQITRETRNVTHRGLFSREEIKHLFSYPEGWEWILFMTW